MELNKLFSEANLKLQKNVPRKLVKELVDEYRKEFQSSPECFSDLLEVLE